MTATVIDNRRRLVMPPELPARSSVTVQQIDEDTWIVKRLRPTKTEVVVLLPDIKKLPQDPEWEALEVRFVAHTNKNRRPFEEA